MTHKFSSMTPLIITLRRDEPVNIIKTYFHLKYSFMITLHMCQHHWLIISMWLLLANTHSHSKESILDLTHILSYYLNKNIQICAVHHILYNMDQTSQRRKREEKACCMRQTLLNILIHITFYPKDKVLKKKISAK